MKDKLVNWIINDRVVIRIACFVVVSLAYALNFYNAVTAKHPWMIAMYVGLCTLNTALVTWFMTREALTRHNYFFWRHIQEGIDRKLKELDCEKQEYSIEIRVGIPNQPPDRKEYVM